MKHHERVVLSALGGRPLTRGRGLKRMDVKTAERFCMSPPHTGAWIETGQPLAAHLEWMVAPSHGGVD